MLRAAFRRFGLVSLPGILEQRHLLEPSCTRNFLIFTITLKLFIQQHDSKLRRFYLRLRHFIIDDSLIESGLGCSQTDIKYDAHTLRYEEQF